MAQKEELKQLGLQNYQLGDFYKAKKYFDEYLDILNLNLNVYEVELHREITFEYIDILTHFFELNISWKNPMLTRFFSARNRIIKNRIPKNEEEESINMMFIHRLYDRVFHFNGDEFNRYITCYEMLERIIEVDSYAVENVYFLTCPNRKGSFYREALEVNLIKEKILDWMGTNNISCPYDPPSKPVKKSINGFVQFNDYDDDIKSYLTSYNDDLDSDNQSSEFWNQF
jgi:tetratricopeptide (TPR) repeat protein